MKKEKRVCIVCECIFYSNHNRKKTCNEECKKENTKIQTKKHLSLPEVKQRVDAYKKTYQKKYNQKAVYDNHKVNPTLSRAKLMRKSMKNNSKYGKKEFDSSLFTVDYIHQWLMTQPNCECCNVVFDPVLEKGMKKSNCPTSDRMDSNLGYVKGNVHLICWKCNWIKGHHKLSDHETVVNWMKKIERMYI